ncbi:nickel pincer cofactor biosynthesis protein LarC [Halorubrum sp. DTA98]|uniref:nickel pincer cofactor biosynthesis protein LarC n=1 Tax=Halorubrum sp. DTA98 TaxID=3402163 RepID=UPI003AAD5F81
MRTLAFDGRTGAAGDMICAALIAAGADPDVLARVEQHLPVRYDIGETVKHGIRATTVDVLLAETDVEDPDDSDGHAERSGVHRTYPEVVSLVESMGLPDRIESTALDAFELLGRAEASVHGTDLAATHFHEVGADDAIADVVGAMLLLDDLDVDRVVTTPVSVGGGTVEMSHGEYPVPGPAVVEIAERTGLAIVGGPIDRELLTPTGAAILGAVAESVDVAPGLTVSESGYGAGDATFERRPNVLRAIVGDGGTGGDRLVHDDVAVLETNLDDASPEVLGGLQQTLKNVGARDVTIVPTTMKKSRPGHLVTVVCKPADAEAVAARLARETGTLGVRQTGATHRWIAERQFETAVLDVDGDEYEVAVKLASTADGDVYDVSAEYDDAATVAERTGLPVRTVLQRAEAAIRGSD